MKKILYPVLAIAFFASASANALDNIRPGFTVLDPDASCSDLLFTQVYHCQARNMTTGALGPCLSVTVTFKNVDRCGANIWLPMHPRNMSCSRLDPRLQACNP
ncbi:MAG: hypothetical protein ACN2B6_05760 [Rickettsiales bacterium]